MKPEINIIPLPNCLTKEDGEYKITSTSEVSVIIEKAAADTELKKQLETAFLTAGLRLSDSGTPVNVEIIQNTSAEESEAYTINISDKGIKLMADSSKGVFYACISLAQMISKSSGTLPFVTIEDKPAYTWRGFLLDTCRSFFSISFIKKMLDACALHKLNIFHWHLTDDQGWRFEVPGYPRLTEIGSV